MPNLLKLVSWNINSDRRVEIFDRPPFMYIANAFKNFSVHKRFPAIVRALDYFRAAKKVPLFALQEVEDSVLAELCAYLGSKGLNTHTTKYNPTEGAFNYIFAYDPALYELIETEQIYLTQSGSPTPEEVRAALSSTRDKTEETIKEDKAQLFARHLDSEFEKSSQIIVLRDRSSGEFIMLVNNHLGLSNKHRLEASALLCSKVKAKAGEIETRTGKKPQVVMAGDFNQFDSTRAEATLLKEQVDIYRGSGFKWVSECLQRQEPKGTFINAPYDIMRFLNREDLAEYDVLKLEFDKAIRLHTQLPSADTDRAMEDCSKKIHDFFIAKINDKKIPMLSTDLDAVFVMNEPEIGSAVKPSRCKAILFNSAGERVKPMPKTEAIQASMVDLYARDEALPSDHLPILAKVNI